MRSRCIGLLLLSLLIPWSTECAAEAEKAKPNVVIFFLDDSGYSDFRPFGNPSYPTPNFDRLASGGTRYTQFYVPQAVCSASRASLMTGCYPGRTKVFGAIRPGARGLETNFKTMGEVFQQAGYATAVFGKWHIGDHPDTQPQSRGFEESCGLMYSNDMWAGHPENPKEWSEKPLQFYENGKVTIDSVTAEDQKNLTRWYTEHAVQFIERRKDAPFLLYVPHNLPHVPLFCGKDFEGKSGAGLYGDVAMELDWSLGQILDALERVGVGENTLVLFTSDNGPWSVYGNHSGTTPFREAKGTTFDGGTRSACIIQYPGRIPAGAVNDNAWCSIDILPTLAALAQVPLPDYPIDGKDVWPLISGMKHATNPHEFYGFSLAGELQAVMSGDGRWKLHLPHKYRQVKTVGGDGKPGKYVNLEQPPALYDLKADPLEEKNLLTQHPKLAMKMAAWGNAHAKEFYSRQRK